MLWITLDHLCTGSDLQVLKASYNCHVVVVAAVVVGDHIVTAVAAVADTVVPHSIVVAVVEFGPLTIDGVVVVGVVAAELLHDQGSHCQHLGVLFSFAAADFAHSASEEEEPPTLATTSTSNQPYKRDKETYFLFL